MDSLLPDSPDEVYHLIRLPKEMVERAKRGETKLGSVHVYENNCVEIQDNVSKKVYSLVRNVPKRDGDGSGSNQRQNVHVAPSEESDLFKISLQKGHAIQLGKIKSSALLAVPKADD